MGRPAHIQCAACSPSSPNRRDIRTRDHHPRRPTPFHPTAQAEQLPHLCEHRPPPGPAGPSAGGIWRACRTGRRAAMGAMPLHRLAITRSPPHRCGGPGGAVGSAEHSVAPAPFGVPVLDHLERVRGRGGPSYPLAGRYTPSPRSSSGSSWSPYSATAAPRSPLPGSPRPSAGTAKSSQLRRCGPSLRLLSLKP